jgi:isoquinoline 1-oxidoreductase beta subunit
MVAEVSVSAQGELRVHRIVVAIDSGHVVNPDACRAQAESCVVLGQGAVLYQENNLKNGRIVESNFHDFPLPTMAGMPKVGALLVLTGVFRRRYGEPAMLPLAPAVCNAVPRAA